MIPGLAVGAIRGIRGYNPAKQADELAAAMRDPSDSAKTQIAQVNKAGEPTGTGKTYGKFEEMLEPDDTIIDYGAGKGQGISASRPGVHRHEPYPEGWTPSSREIKDIPPSEYDAVINNATMNVVTPETQRVMAQGMMRGVKPGGRILSSSRGPGTTEAIKTGEAIEGLEGVSVPGRGYQENITPKKYVRAFGDNVDYGKLPKGVGDTGFDMRVKPIEHPKDVQAKLDLMDWDPETMIGRKGPGGVSIHRDYALHEVPQDAVIEAAKVARKKGMDDWNMIKYNPKTGKAVAYRGTPQFMEVGPDHPQFADLVRNAPRRPFPLKEIAANRRARRTIDSMADELMRKQGLK